MQLAATILIWAHAQLRVGPNDCCNAKGNDPHGQIALCWYNNSTVFSHANI